MWWDAVSPFKPYGPLIALIFVVGVAAIKAIFEDRKRHQEDDLLNNSIAHVLQPDGAPASVRQWQSSYRSLGFRDYGEESRV